MEVKASSALIISDVHLGGEGSVLFRGNSTWLLTYLRGRLTNDPDLHLILVGDIVDPMGSACCQSIGTRTDSILVEDECARTLVQWANEGQTSATSQTSRVHFVYGNHDDLGTEARTWKKLGAVPRLLLHIGNHTFWVEHGQIIDRPTHWCCFDACLWWNKCFDKLLACLCCEQSNEKDPVSAQFQYVQDVCHDHSDLSGVILGHTHVPKCEEWKDANGNIRWWINPGSAVIDGKGHENDLQEVTLSLDSSQKIITTARTVQLSANLT